MTQKTILATELLAKQLFRRSVSSTENRKNLDSQAKRLSQYCTAKGYQIIHVVKEVGSGLNDHRKKLEKLLTLDDYDLNDS